MARTSASRVNLKRITDNLRVAARKGDRTALTLALEQMKTLALSPRYWEKYLGLLRNPQARLVDLLVIKQGERIARQKGWKVPPQDRLRGPSPRSKRRSRRQSESRRSSSAGEPRQTSLFD